MLFFFYILKQEAMANLFFDLLPTEIRKEIYGIRLSNAVRKNYYWRLAKKVALARFVLKLEMSYDFILYDFGHHSIPYFNPINSDVRYVAERCSEFITSYDDKVWWISQLIRPIEEGLIINSRIISPSSIGTRLMTKKHHNAIENYKRTEYAVDQLIEIFGCRRNPRRCIIDWGLPESPTS
jgi:hypothetical protein